MHRYKNMDFAGNKWTSSTNRKFNTRNETLWLNKKTKPFTIGSCFAVNFGRWISKHDVSIVTPDWGLHYNSKTILNELHNCIGVDSPKIVWEVTPPCGDTSYFDAKRHPISANSLQGLASKQSMLTEAGRQAIVEASAFLITLGLTEIWEQRLSSGWSCINRSPLKHISNRRKPNFRNRFQTIKEIKADIKSITTIIGASSTITRPIVFTVSPIPLKNSGMQYDPRIANVRSKSNIISAIHEFLDENPSLKHVSYFPAFEMFYQAPDYENIWQRDGRHVTARKIDEVCRMFVDIYSTNSALFQKKIDFQVPEV